MTQDHSSSSQTTASKPHSNKDKRPVSRKHHSRVLALQALYQWQLTEQDIGVINGQFLQREEMSAADLPYFQELFQQIPLKLDTINEALGSALTRPMSLVNPIEKSILWIGAYELSYRLDIPYKVVLNEAIDLAKDYGGEGAHTLVNATLDKLAHDLRKLELAAKAQQNQKS